MINTTKSIRQKPDTVVQQIIDIFGKKKKSCGCSDTGSSSADDHAMTKGSGEPTADTPGELGDFYLDELTGNVYECTEITSQSAAGGINMKQIRQLSDGPDISYFNTNAWQNNDFGVLYSSNCLTLAKHLYKLTGGRLMEITTFFNTTDEREIEAAFSVGFDYVVLAKDGTFFVCTKGSTIITKSYKWVELTHRAITTEEIEGVTSQNSTNVEQNQQ